MKDKRASTDSWIKGSTKSSIESSSTQCRTKSNTQCRRVSAESSIEGTQQQKSKRQKLE